MSTSGVLARVISLDEIRIDGWTQPRTAISEDTVREYAESMLAGAAMPPVDLFFDGATYWLADGFHRYHAAKQIGLKDVSSTVHAGTRRDAVWFSAGANQTHGLRRTNEDKRRAVSVVLDDEVLSKTSGEQIAKHCGVSNAMVSQMKAQRASLLTVKSEKQAAVNVTTKHGTATTMNTENIGRGKAPQPAAPEPPKFKSREAVQQRREQMRDMAAGGHTSTQIASKLGITVESARSIAKKQSIDVPADRVTAGLHRHNSTRIMERTVIDAENLTADVNLIEFDDLDPARFAEWLGSLKSSRDKFGEFIRRLMKEQQKHGEAA